MTRRALITGITGQDGSYLAELLLSKGYEVAGTTRSVAAAASGFLAPIIGRITLYEASLTDDRGLADTIAATRPDEIYNLAGQTRVGPSWDDPVATADIDALSVARLLQAIRHHAPTARVFQASTCDMFESTAAPLNEGSRFEPPSPYGVAKLYGHYLVGSYRRMHGTYAVSGILFNHESPRRSAAFVTRKITRAAARIVKGLEQSLTLGNTDVRRDWGFAPDYARAMWLMLQANEPEDLVIGTGEAHSVREFCEAAFGVVGLDYRDYLRMDGALVRGNDPPVRVADATRARERLGWAPEVSFSTLVRMMVEADLELATT